MSMDTIAKVPHPEMAADDHSYLRTHRVSGDVLSFQLLADASQLHELAASSPAGRAGKTLVKERSLRITQLALQKGMTLDWHELAGPACVQVLLGHLQMMTAEGKMDLVPGALVVFDGGVQHSATAIRDCVMLITMSLPEVVHQ